MSTSMPAWRRHCKSCGSRSLFWFTRNVTTSDVPEGRLRTNEVQCMFVLGCEECSDTVATISADDVAVQLTHMEIRT